MTKVHSIEENISFSPIKQEEDDPLAESAISIDQIVKGTFAELPEVPKTTSPFLSKDPQLTREFINFYLKWDQKTQKKGLEAIQKGEEYADQLKRLKIVWDEILKKIDDLPEEFSFSEKADPSMPLLEELGYIEKDQRTFSKQEIKVLKAQIEADMEILPRNINTEQGKVTRFMTMSNLVMKVAAEALNEQKAFIRRIHERTASH